MTRINQPNNLVLPILAAIAFSLSISCAASHHTTRAGTLGQASSSAAMEAMLAVGVKCATDVTGFGLLGHLHNLATASKLSARIDASGVPLLPLSREQAEAGAVPGGTTRNLEAARAFVHWSEHIAEIDRVMLADAQTSGGLLIAASAERLPALLDELKRRDVSGAVIGRLESGESGRIEVA